MWNDPLETGGLPILKYLLRVSSIVDSQTIQEVKELQPYPAMNDFYSPESGYFITGIGSKALVPGQTVSVRVAACNSGAYPNGTGDGGHGTGTGCSAYAPSGGVEVHVGNSTPGIVSTPLVHSINATHLIVQVPDAAHTGGQQVSYYEVKAYTMPSSSQMTFRLAAADSPRYHVVTERSQSLSYAYEARAVNEVGAGPWSEPLWVQSGAQELPSTPINVALIAGSETQTSFGIEWRMPNDNRSHDILQYVVSLQSSGDPAFKVLPSLPSMDCIGTTCNATVQAAPATTFVAVALAAQNSYSQGAFSDSFSVTTQASPPGRVGDLAVTAVGADSLTVNFTAADDNGAAISEYRIHACDVQAAGCLVHMLGVQSSSRVSAVLSGLDSGRNWTIAVEALNSIGSGGNVTLAEVYTTLAPPLRPDRPFRANPLPGLPLTTTIHVKWVAPFDNGVGIEDYNLTILDLEKQTKRHVVIPHIANGPGIYEYTSIGLYPSTSHKFSVVARNALGVSTPSEEAELTTDDDKPGTPPAPYEILSTQSKIMVGLYPSSYDGGTAIIYYELEVNGGTPIALSNTPVIHLNHTLANRNPTIEYRFRSRAVNQLRQTSLWSDYLIIASIQSNYPSQPLDVAAINVQPRSFTLSWRLEDNALSENIVSHTLSIARPDSNVTTSLTLPQQDCVNTCTQLIDASLLAAIAPYTNYSLSLVATNSFGPSTVPGVADVRTLATAPEAPTGVAVSNEGQTGMDVAWAAPAANGDPISRYVVYACDAQSGGCVLTSVTGSPLPATSVSVTGLSAGRNYTIAVAAENTIGLGPNGTAGGAFTTHAPPQQCEAPVRALELEGLDNVTSIHVQWVPPFDNGRPITGYQLVVDGKARSIPASQTQFILSSLYPGTSHNFSVAALNSIGAGAASDVTVLLTQADAPGRPPAPTSIVNQHTIIVTVLEAPYDGGFDLASYDLAIFENGAARPLVTLSVSGVLEHTLNDRDSGIRYTFQTRARNVRGTAGKWSPVLTVASVAAQFPNSPRDVTLSGVTPRSFTISWRLPDHARSDAISSHRLSISHAPTNVSILLPLTQTSCKAAEGSPLPCSQLIDAASFSSITESTLVPSTNYSLLLTAVNSYGSSVPAAVHVVTLADVPDGPSGVTVSNVGSTGMDVSWTAPAANGADVVRYFVYACDGTGGCERVKVSGGSPPFTSVQLDGLLEPGRNYTIAVAAENSIGLGPNGTASGTYTTLSVPQQCEPAVRAPRLNGLPNTTVIHVSWAAPFDNGRPITGYRLLVNGQSIEIDASSTLLQYTHVNLLPASTHTFNVIAVNALGESQISDNATFTTAPSVPLKPQPPTHRPGGADDRFTIEVYEPYDSGSSISSFEVEARYYVGSTFITWVGNVTPPANTLTLTAPTYIKGVAYDIYVRAQNAHGFSPYSDPLKVLPATISLAPTPYGLVGSEGACIAGASGLQSCQLGLQWSQPFSNDSTPIYYRIEYALCPASCPGSIDSSNPVVEVSAAVAASSCPADATQALCFTLADLRPNSRYKLQVRSGNNIGTSAASSAIEVNFPAAQPDQPTNLAVTPTQTTLEVNFSAPTSYNGAVLERYRITACDLQMVGVCVGLDVADGDPLPQYGVVGGLTPGRNFSVVVEAFNSWGGSGNASVTGGGFFTTLAPPLPCDPPFPYSPTLEGLPSTTTIHIAWRPPFENGAPITSYTLYADGIPNTVVHGSQFLHYGLVPGTEHVYQVAATNALGTGALSQIFNYTTSNGPAAVPDPPSQSFISINGLAHQRLVIKPVAYSGVAGQGVLHYQLEEVILTGTGDAAIYNVSADSLRLDRPRNAVQDYGYRARAVTVVGPGPWSAITVIPNDFSNVASQPGNVTVDENTVDQYSFTVRWTLPVLDKNANASFLLRLLPTGNSTGAELRRDATTLGESCSPSGAYLHACAFRTNQAQPNTQYRVDVASENAFGVSLVTSASNLVWTPPGRPEAPGELIVIAATTSSLDVRWTTPRPNGRPILGYVFAVETEGRGPGALRSYVAGPTGEVLEAYDSCASLISSGSPPSSAASLPQGSKLSFTIGNLTDGASFLINASTCNSIGESLKDACVCDDPLCRKGCVREPIPAHTHAIPAKPIPPAQVADPNLAPEKSRTLFVTWTLPKDHGKPVEEVEVKVGNLTFNVLIGGSGSSSSSSRMQRRRLTTMDDTSLNVTGLDPATIYPVSVRMRNVIGWGEWSPTAYLSTTPERPARPPAPVCDADGNGPDRLEVAIGEANSNGLAILEYEVRVTHSEMAEMAEMVGKYGHGFLYWASVPADIEPLAHLVTADNSSRYAFSAFGGNTTLNSSTPYNVTVRARNEIGWGEWSEAGIDCATTRELVLFDLLVIVIPLAACLCCLCCCVIIWKCTDAKKILAPRTKKLELNQDPLEDFIVKEDTAMEDLDPELNMNPVLLAKIALEHEAAHARKRGGKAKPTGGGPVTGGLKRLGINLAGKEDSGPKKIGLKEIDVRLQAQAKAEKEQRRKEREERKKAQTEQVLALARSPGGKAGPSEALGGGGGSARDSQRMSVRENEGEIDFARTLTVRTKTKREKNRAKAADRMVAQAQAATLRADKAKIARAAAHLPVCRESGEESSIPALDKQVSTSVTRYSDRI